MQIGDRVRPSRLYDVRRRDWTVVRVDGHASKDLDDRRITAECGDASMTLHVSRWEKAS